VVVIQTYICIEVFTMVVIQTVVSVAIYSFVVYLLLFIICFVSKKILKDTEVLICIILMISYCWQPNITEWWA
jgi:hypothetical protein